jgi:heme-degrading monooxygenase HmoA
LIKEIDWDTIDDHKRFMASPGYGPFLQNFGVLFAVPPKPFHFTPKPFPPSIIGSAPCTEVAMFFQVEEQFLGNLAKFAECLKDQDGYLGHAFGETVEEIEKEEGSGMGKAIVLYIGWTNKDAHMKFRESKSFEANIHLLRSGRGAADMVSRHNMIKLDFPDVEKYSTMWLSRLR